MHPSNKWEVDLAEKQLMDEFLWFTANKPRWKYRSLVTIIRVCIYNHNRAAFRVDRITYGICDRSGEIIRTVSWPKLPALGPSYRKAGVSLAARLFRC